jgi:hypothetical protein
MKKKLILMLAAALSLCACQKGGLFAPEETAQDSGPIRFKIAAQKMTRAFASEDATELNMPVIASFYHSDGTPIEPSIYNMKTSDGTGFPVQLAYLEYLAGGYAYLNGDTKFVFPLGDVHMDALAFAFAGNSADNVSYLSNLSDWKTAIHFQYMEDSNTDWKEVEKGTVTDYLGAAGWLNPVFSDKDNYTKKVQFMNVDTWRYPQDLMYASANNLTNEHPVGHLNFEHASAAVIFNVRTVSVPGNKVHLHNLLFLDPDKFDDEAISNGMRYKLLAGENIHSDYLSSYGDYKDGVISIKSVATLTVDNSKNKIEASWKIKEKILNYWDKMSTNYYLAENNSVSMLNQNFATNAFTGYDYTMEGKDANSLAFLGADEDFQQWGPELLLPEQPSVNPYIWYSIVDNSGQEKFYLYELNMPRHNWKAGRAYIYNLTLHFETPRFTVEVQPWVGYLANEGYDWNYNYLDDTYDWTSSADRGSIAAEMNP